eukprot:TRINITY_DN122211_c0_g1_i1.p1 TRINITY_DN122211_c0_g1~~TRINITY_DN122211_c0_g1_i1.p1  ORF type:complete len:707 (+),score=149.09 TRINITY_DN122211_c0_g1_i1:75-2195(+)
MCRPNAATNVKEWDEAALFSAVEAEIVVASLAGRRGQLRQAAAVMRRAHALATSRVGLGGSQWLAARVARATVTLQYCALLSRFQRHGEALDEALAAAKETEEVWQALLSAEDARAEACRRGNFVAMAMSDDCPFSLLLRSPPRWLTTAARVSVQARHSVALEMEYTMQHQQRQAATGHPEVDADVETGPRWALIAALHREAAWLCEKLLPRDSGLQASSVKVEAQAAARRQEAERQVDTTILPEPLPGVELVAEDRRPFDGVGESPYRDHDDDSVVEDDEDDDDDDFDELGAGFTGTLHRGLLPRPGRPQTATLQGRQGEVLAPAAAPSAGAHCHKGHAADSTAGEPRYADQASRRPGTANAPRSSSAGALRAAGCPAVDVVAPRLLQQRPASALPLRRPGSSASSRSMPALHHARPAQQPENVFADWLNTCTDADRQSMLKKRLATEDGLKQLHDDIRREGQWFRQQVLPHFSNEEIWAASKVYSNAGRTATRTAQRLNRRCRRSRPSSAPGGGLVLDFQPKRKRGLDVVQVAVAPSASRGGSRSGAPQLEGFGLAKCGSPTTSALEISLQGGSFSRSPSKLFEGSPAAARPGSADVRALRKALKRSFDKTSLQCGFQSLAQAPRSSSLASTRRGASKLEAVPVCRAVLGEVPQQHEVQEAAQAKRCLAELPASSLLPPTESKAPSKETLSRASSKNSKKAAWR